MKFPNENVTCSSLESNLEGNEQVKSLDEENIKPESASSSEMNAKITDSSDESNYEED